MKAQIRNYLVKTIANIVISIMERYESVCEALYARGYAIFNKAE
jgi:hypothetical protein